MEKRSKVFKKIFFQPTQYIIFYCLCIANFSILRLVIVHYDAKTIFCFNNHMFYRNDKSHEQRSTKKMMDGHTDRVSYRTHVQLSYFIYLLIKYYKFYLSITCKRSSYKHQKQKCLLLKVRWDQPTKNRPSRKPKIIIQ